MDQFDKQHNFNLEKASKEVKAAYLDAIKEVSKLGVNMKLDANGQFNFDANPAIKAKVDAILEKLYQKVYTGTVTGINSSWDVAVNQNNAMALSVFGKELENLPSWYKTKILSNNAQAKRNFVERRAKGLGLSDRVWKNTQQFRQDLEYALELGIGKGQSAASLATEIKQYLNHPNKLFRRVRDKKTGKLKLSRAAKDYHPGQGRYRSSYKNAQRLAANEINISYEASAHEKHQQQDFVVGKKIIVSPQHKRSDDKGGIQCFELQGNYPKDFDWSNKWHVKCKCASLTILKTREEMREDTKKILQGKEPDTKSKNEVNEVPEHFKEYVKTNEKKWANWKNQPRFMEYNKDVINRKVVKPEIIIPEIKKPTFSNITFKSVEEANTGSTEWINSLSDIEKKSVFEYTKSSYRPINWKLMGIKDVTTKNDLIYIENLENVLTNSPKIKMTSYRGMVLEDKVFEEFSKLKKGDKYVSKGFMSTSVLKEKAEDFATSSNNLVHMVVEGKSGTYINQLADDKREAEILFNKDSEFIVSKIKLKKGFLNEIFITIKEKGL